MSTLNTAIVTAFLAIGLAGNAMAAPNNHSSERNNKIVKKVVVKKNAPKQIVVKKAAPKKAVVRKAAPKKVVVVKQAPKKSYKAKTYRVRSGDTLSKIAARNRVSVNQLIKLNKLWGNKANQLRVGMSIRLS